MDFVTWLRSIGIDPATLKDFQREAFQHHFDTHQAAGREVPRIYYRTVDLEIRTIDDADDGSFVRDIVLSTENPVEWYNFTEVLSHKKGAIDTDTLRALLFNHNANFIIGPIRKAWIENRQLIIRVEVYEEAVMPSGVPVRKAVDDGSLRGASIGYTYSGRDCDWDEESRVLTARKWRALEGSLTPIPADKQSQVGRSLPFDIASKQGRQAQEENPMSFKKWLASRGLDPAHLTRQQYQALLKDYRAECERAEWTADVDVDEPAEGQRSAAPTPPPATPPATPAPGDEAARAAELARERTISQIRDLADSHGIVLTQEQRDSITDWNQGRALVERLVTERAAAGGGTPRVNLGAPGVRVTADAADKYRTGALGGLLRQSGLRIDPEVHGKDVAAAAHRGGINSITAMARYCAELEGNQGARYWDNLQCASYVASQLGSICRLAHEIGIGTRDAANQDSGHFATLLASATTKVLMEAFNQFEDITYDKWCTQREVPDFKTNKNVGLAAGNLTETAENHAFPELTLEDGGYDSGLALWGATLSLTMQAIANDDVGGFMRKLAQAGFIARRTIERQVFYKLLNATWTYDVTTGAALGTAGNLDKVIAALRGKLDMAGNRMGITPKYLLHDPITRQAARQDCGVIIAPGQTTMASVAIEPLESPWVGDTNLEATAATSDYYLVGDPRIYDTVLVELLRGILSPIVAPFDPGAVAAEKVKIMLPFQATVATHTDSAAHARVTGIQHQDVS
jgi:HK97 family phage prohead protease